MNTRISFFCLVLLLGVVAHPLQLRAATIPARVSGQVLLQVQSHGEAWYVNPVDGRRYYLKNGAAAYTVMRKLGLGISNANFAKFMSGNAVLRARLRGRIVLKTEDHGKAYYLCPRTGRIEYLKDGAAAYQIMRGCGLGVTNATLATIPQAEVSFVPPSAPPVLPPTEPTPPAIVIPPTTSIDLPHIAGCQVFPADNPWNQDISALPVHANSATYISSIGLSKKLHPDFGWKIYGMPYTVVSGSQPKVPITFTAYGNESDPGPYPIPLDAKQESGSDAHMLVVDKDACKLYELFHSARTANGWSGDSGAVWDLKSNALRPLGWTSADAAGLPILPGLVRYDEVAAGEIKHAIRFTAPATQRGYILPATHFAGQNNPSLPPMGLRVRLKANYDISKLTGEAKVIATAMKKYGMILADNGSSWFFQGSQDDRWNDDELNQLKVIPGSAFEAVETGEIHR